MHISKLFLAALIPMAAMTISSCQSEELSERTMADQTECSIIADFGSTRTTNQEMSTAWASGDAMSVFYSNAGEANYKVSKYSFVGSGNEFTGSVSHLGATNDWLLFYPYDESNASATSVKYTVAAAQTQQGNSSTSHLCGENFPLFGKSLGIAKADQMTISVENVNAALVFDVTNTEDYPVIVKEVVFTAPTVINGDFTADLTAESFQAVADGNNSKIATITVSGGASIAKGESASFYAGVIPFSAESGSKLNVTVKAVKAEDPTQIIEYAHTYTLSSRVTFTAGVLKHFTVNFEESSTYEPTVKGYSLVTSVPEDWSGKYIIVSANKQFIFTGEKGTSNSYEIQASDLNNGIITKDCSAYEFTIQKSGSYYYLSHNGQYIYCNYSAGDGTTGIAYSSSQQALSFTLKSNGTFGFWMNEGSVDQHLYYKTTSSGDYFKFGGSHNDNCVYLYKYSEENTTPGTDPVPSGDTYVKVTSAPTDWSGTYLVVDESSSKAFAFDNTSGYNVSVSINNGTIAATDALAHYALTITGVGVKHANNTSLDAYNVKTSTGKYIFYSNSAINISDNDYKVDSGTTYNYYHTFTFDNGVQMMSGRHQNGANKYYMYYSNGFGYAQDGSDNRIQLYKLGGSGSSTPTPSTQDGVYNLENSSVKSYLTAAASSYSDTDYSSNSIVTQYSSNSSTNRKDAPAPVALSWTSSASGTSTVSVYSNSSMTDQVMSTTTTNSSVNILNLVPGRQYWYKVMSSTNSQIASGDFTTEGRRRMVKVSDTYAIGHANNCRDLGGLTTTDGKTLNYGKIFRGTNMDATTDAEKEYITGFMNVALDVDLRSSSTWGYGGGDSGSSSSYNPYSNSKWGVTYCNAGFNGAISDFYVGTADDRFKQLFTAILSTLKSGKAAYIHCYVGADRTGYTCMLLEAVLGVSMKDCSIDFELTSFSVVGTRTRTGSGNTIGKDGLNYISGYSKGQTFKEKAYNILIDYGVTASQIEEFRSLMLQ